MLTVALDAAPLAGERTGIGVGVAGLVSALVNEPDLKLICYGLTGSHWSEVKSLLPPGAGHARAAMPAAPLLRIWRSLQFPVVELWTGRVDVVHGTNFVVPPARRAGRIVTVHDLTAVRFPELCTPTSRMYPRLVQRAVDHGSWVHTVSHFVAAEVIEHFGALPERVVVVPHGIAAPGVLSTPAQSPPYILALGTAEPRKDYPGLVKAFDMVADGLADLQLWIVGPEGWAESQLSAAVRQARHGDRVRRLGWLPDVTGTLSRATLLAYPSLYEGFGLPPLEAMAAGVPVVATSAGSIPEVVGDAALLVPPGDPAAMAGAIAKVVSDEALRAALIRRGLDRAGQFSWEATASGLRSAYATVSTHSSD